jgi:hypothetical protein
VENAVDHPRVVLEPLELPLVPDHVWDQRALRIGVMRDHLDSELREKLGIVAGIKISRHKKNDPAEGTAGAERFDRKAQAATRS